MTENEDTTHIELFNKIYDEGGVDAFIDYLKDMFLHGDKLIKENDDFIVINTAEMKDHEHMMSFIMDKRCKFYRWHYCGSVYGGHYYFSREGTIYMPRCRIVDDERFARLQNLNHNLKYENDIMKKIIAKYLIPNFNAIHGNVRFEAEDLTPKNLEKLFFDVTNLTEDLE